MEGWYRTYNHAGAVPLADLPRFDYPRWFGDMSAMLEGENYHCAACFALPEGDGLLLVALMLDDASGEVWIASCRYDTARGDVLPSLSARYPAMHAFEREIAESFGIAYSDHPWNKPLRFAHDRADRTRTINNYPFYHIGGDSLHEVNVGPIHAGIIEPGVFRFICNGEEVLHLEIVLGYQHRGVERLMRETPNRLRQVTLAETVAGDSSVAHAMAHAALVEKLMRSRADAGAVARLDRERATGIELERIAVHIGDTGALCMDVGYQLGQVACEALRTVVINTTQRWCGNRFGKGLVRPGGTHYPMSEAVREDIFANMADVEARYAEVAHNLSVVPSVLARFEDCGTVTRSQMVRIGAVGQAARASGLGRDIRATHPYGAYRMLDAYEPVLQGAGDVMARLGVRCREVARSVQLIRELLKPAAAADAAPAELPPPDYTASLRPEALSFALVEGWRGEICHAGITDAEGRWRCYKVKDPSMHNWLALALAVRGEGISDFPVCNKSFNLSYCGHDL